MIAHHYGAQETPKTARPPSGPVDWLFWKRWAPLHTVPVFATKWDDARRAALLELGEPLGAVEGRRREGESITTIGGRRFYLFDPSPHEVDIGDIAHHLALLCRFNGAVPLPYNVAQHSVLVSYAVPDRHALQGLLHDSPEAFVGDMTSPLKRRMPEFKRIESDIWRVIAAKYGVPFQLAHEVERADKRMLVTEQRDVRRVGRVVEHEVPYKNAIRAWSWRCSKRRFLERFEELTRHSGQQNNERANG